MLWLPNFLRSERGAQDYAIYLLGVAECLMVEFHLFIGAPTQEASLLEAEFRPVRGLTLYSVVSYFKLPRELTSRMKCFPLSDSSSFHPLRDIWTTKNSTVRLTFKQ